MASLKEIFEKHYNGYKDDELTSAVERFFEDDANFQTLKELNGIGIPPAFAFIFMTQEENSGLFRKYLNGDQKYHRYFGELFGAVFYEKGYKKDKTVHNNTAFLDSASLFRKDGSDQ